MDLFQTPFTQSIQMRRLTDFAGFSVKKNYGGREINPFAGLGYNGDSETVPVSVHSSAPPSAPCPIPSSTPSPIPAIIVPFSPLIDSSQPITPLAPLAISAEPDAPILSFSPPAVALTTPEEEQKKEVALIQPRDKDGNRLLYRHPNLPRVGPKKEYYLMVGQSDKSATAHLLQFDGAANPNPGPASSGAVLWSPPDKEGKRTVLFEYGKFLGKATNNIAEAQGILLALKVAAMRNAREILIEGDSELIIFQQIGKYKVSDKKLKVWWSETQAAMMDESSFDWIAVRQVRREFNERADSITKEVLGRKEGFMRGY